MAERIGFDALHFEIIMVSNLALGLIKPPVGMCLYIGSVVSGLEVEQIIKTLIPFYLILVLGLLVIVLFPQFSQGFALLIFH